MTFWLLIISASFSLVLSIYFENVKWACCKTSTGFNGRVFGRLTHDHKPRYSITKHRLGVLTLVVSFACIISAFGCLFEVCK